MKILMTLAMALAFIPAFAQQEVLMDTVPTTDGFYQANNLEEAVPFVYPEVNMKNIRFYKRVWRDIDLKDEKNALLATPGNSLIEIIMKAIEAGKLSLYSPDDDSFKARMNAKDGFARFTDSVLVPIFDSEGNQIDSKMTLNEFDPSRVTKFRIKEDIFFDKQRSRLESRIIGVAPLMNITTSSELAETVGSTPAFWLYFPQLRYSLVKVDITDVDKGIYDMTMDDLFVQKKYASTIIRESSAGAMKLGDEAQQMQDAQQIEQKIDAYKKKLWTSPKGVKEENLEEFIPNAQKQKKAKKK